MNPKRYETTAAETTANIRRYYEAAAAAYEVAKLAASAAVRAAEAAVAAAEEGDNEEDLRRAQGRLRECNRRFPCV
jgi:hypothetical protein